MTICKDLLLKCHVLSHYVALYLIDFQEIHILIHLKYHFIYFIITFIGKKKNKVVNFHIKKYRILKFVNVLLIEWLISYQNIYKNLLLTALSSGYALFSSLFS